MNGKCMVPNCKAVADKTWTLVPVCELHHEELRKEHADYIKKVNNEKPVFESIRHLTPWRKKP